MSGRYILTLCLGRVEDCKWKVDMTSSFQTFACIDCHCYCLFLTGVAIELLTVLCSSHFANLMSVKVLNVLKREVLRRSDDTNFCFFLMNFRIIWDVITCLLNSLYQHIYSSHYTTIVVVFFLSKNHIPYLIYLQLGIFPWRNFHDS